MLIDRGGFMVVGVLVELSSKNIDKDFDYAVNDNLIKIWNYSQENGNVVIKCETELKDNNGKDCTGYVIIQNVDTINHFTSFIKCKNYTSNNY